MEPVVVLAVDLDAEDGAGHFHAPLALEPVSAPARDEAAAAVPQPARPLREPSGRAAGKSSRPDRAARSTRGPNECERVRSERNVTGWGRGRTTPAPGRVAGGRRRCRPTAWPGSPRPRASRLQRADKTAGRTAVSPQKIHGIFSSGMPCHTVRRNRPLTERFHQIGVP